MTSSLGTAARGFADTMSELLNRTVTQGIPVTAIVGKTRAVVGYKVTNADHVGVPIPLTIDKSNASLYLHFVHTLSWDPENTFLANSQSTYTLQFDIGDDAMPLVTYDYVRDVPNKYPEAHLHLHGSSEAHQSLAKLRDIKRSNLDDLHFPVGGRRYRPALEDLIEFCILENFVDKKRGWRAAVEKARDEFYKTQLSAAVRRDPNTAAEALRRDGWTVKP